jgi:ABC-type glycerol-3-phosphate transport system permease component
MKANKPASIRSARRLRDLWIYALLIGGSAVFMWPFLWMASASVKLDREHFAEGSGLLPQRPVPRPVSPYVEERLHADYEHVRMEELLPFVVEDLRARALAWPEGVDTETALDRFARGVFRRVAAFAPGNVWSLPASELAPRLLGLVTPATIETERASLLRGLVVGRLVARSYDLQEEVFVPVDTIASAWKVSGSGKARFLPSASEPSLAAQGRLLAYDLTQGESVELSTVFDVGFPLERLHRLQLFLRPDDTWHALRCEVEMGGRRYRAERSAALGDTQWLALAWQLPGPDDLTNKQKFWTLLREEKTSADARAPESAPGRIRLTIHIERRGSFGAWWAKIARNYRTVLEHVPFGRYVATSLFIVILQVVGTLLSCSLVAYSFARLRWPGRAACFLLMLGTMMLPGQVTMIPQFLIVRELGWYDTLLPLWAPSFFANAFYVFLLCQFMRGIPRDLEDAARIDGCGVLRIYWHVMLPMVRPSLAAIAIFTFMGVWNDFMGPLIYLQDQRLYPLSLGLYALNVQNSLGSNSMGMMMAGSLLMTLPVIAIFFFAQRHFIRGIAMTGMKG